MRVEISHQETLILISTFRKFALSIWADDLFLEPGITFSIFQSWATSQQVKDQYTFSQALEHDEALRRLGCLLEILDCEGCLFSNCPCWFEPRPHTNWILGCEPIAWQTICAKETRISGPSDWMGQRCRHKNYDRPTFMVVSRETLHVFFFFFFW